MLSWKCFVELDFDPLYKTPQLSLLCRDLNMLNIAPQLSYFVRGLWPELCGIEVNGMRISYEHEPCLNPGASDLI